MQLKPLQHSDLRKLYCCRYFLKLIHCWSTVDGFTQLTSLVDKRLYRSEKFGPKILTHVFFSGGTILLKVAAGRLIPTSM